MPIFQLVRVPARGEREYLVPEEFERQIVTGLEEANVVRSIAKVITTSAERKIPVAVSFANLAASGGYWVAMASDRIFAQPATITGSIGIFGIIPTFENTLAKIAASEAGIDGFDDLLTGPTAIAFINGDVVEAAKGLRDFAKANPALVIKGGVLDGKPLDASEVAKLADLESREVLMGKLAGAMLAGALGRSVRGGISVQF